MLMLCNNTVMSTLAVKGSIIYGLFQVRKPNSVLLIPQERFTVDGRDGGGVVTVMIHTLLF